MLEDKDQELHLGVDDDENSDTTGNTVAARQEDISNQDVPVEVVPDSDEDKDTPETLETNTAISSSKEGTSKPEDEENDAVEEEIIEEIEQTNAEDAEDTDNHKRHHIPILDYHAMSMENLVGELQKLVRTEKIQAIKKHVDGIKTEFDLKFQDFIEHKKEDFISNGGNEIDFRYNSVTKRQFNEVYGDYREKRDQYYKNLERSLVDNLVKRQEIIEQLKGLVNVEEDINTTYKNFKDLQERWKTAGPIPRANYNDVWRTYHHHIEIFYDFLHLNRELRDLDFKHNLEEKLKIISRAETLAEEPNLNKAFQELQTLHKIWKEDIGPVDKTQREAIWERFSAATKALHKRRQEFYKEQDLVYEKNLDKKKEIIASITELSGQIANNHRTLQQQIKEMEKLREDFFSAGKVPLKFNEATWSAFKEAVRAFNKQKNTFYKNLKREQQENLDKKRALLERAISLKDNEDWDATTPEMKLIQSDWKKIGHVPRKYSDKIWNEFKNACNHYFNRLHALKNKSQQQESQNLQKKKECLERLRAFALSGNREKDIAEIKRFISEWKSHGNVPFHQKNINLKFNKILDALFRKLDIGKQESELLKYGNRLKQLANSDNDDSIARERVFIRRKIEESKSEIRQLENNLQFFSNASEDSPVVQDVIKNIDRQKATLETWKSKLKNLTILEHKRQKGEIEDNSDTETSASDQNSSEEE